MQAIAWLLILFGSLVMLGWLFQVRLLVQVLPGSISMVLNTAICFMLAGVSLLGHGAIAEFGRRIAILSSLLILTLAAVNAVQVVLPVELGINLPQLHAWIADGNPMPGQMAEATTIAFVMAGLALLGLSFGMHRPRLAPLARLLSAMVGIIGLLAMLGYLLRLDGVFTGYMFSSMALPTAFSMSLLGYALWQCWRAPTEALSHERKIVAVGTTALIVVAVVSGLLGIAIFCYEGEATLAKGLSLARHGRAELLSNTLDLRSQRASIVTTRTLLLRDLHVLAANPDDARARLEATVDIDSMMPYGFSSIELRSASDEVLVRNGVGLEAGLPEFPIKVAAPGQASLVWDDGFVLRNRNEIVDGGKRIGSITTEQPLRHLSAGLTTPTEIAIDDQTLLCGHPAGGDRVECFRVSRASGDAVRLELAREENRSMLSAAFAGTSGATRLSRQSGGQQLVAFGPVGSSGLGLLVLDDASAVFLPVVRSLSYGLLIVAAITLLAAWLLGRQIRPLARKLAVSEGRYETVVRCLHEGLVLQDEGNRIVASNPAASSILGLTVEQMSGLTSIDPRWRAIHEDGTDWPGDEHPSVRTLRTGIPESGVIMGIHKPDGSLKWLSVSTMLTSNLGDTEQRGVVVSFEDVTDRRNAEMISLQLEQRFRLLVENVADYGIFMLGLDGTIVSWNKGAERIEGYQSDEILGRNFSCFYTPEDRLSRKPQQELNQATATGRFAEEGWRVRKDGSRFWAGIVISLVHDSHGRHIGFAKVSRDLSERRHSEQLVAEANRLRDGILSNAPYAVIATDLHGTIRIFNPAAERMLWYKAEELVDKFTLAILHEPNEVAIRAAELSQEFGGGIAPGFEVFAHMARLGLTDEREWTYIRKDRSRVPVNLAISALRDGDGTITGFLGIAYDITERKRREDYTKHVAHHDFLTGLPNRMLLNDRLGMAIEQARRAKEKVGVLMLDLDHFKRVNDSLGHHVGDELLKNVAERIRGCVRSIDTVARMGGDEFVVVLGQITNLSDVERIAATIVERVGASMTIGSHELIVTPSIGISHFPAEGEDANALLKNADSAMYRAKAAGRHGYAMFNREMSLQAQKRLDMEHAIQRALTQQEFRIHYQPQVCLETGDVIGMEALLRWEDPVLGPMRPDEFIAVAEECGLIGPLGEWVLRTACKDARALQNQTGRSLRLAVNLSPRQFRQANLLEVIQSSLDDSGLLPEHLELEITEGALMADTDETIGRLREIRNLGATIAIDDFGIGFSSLSYITRFPIDTLKIDRSFVSKLPHSTNDAAVTQAIIALGNSLGITVVAEGVETLAQLDFLRARSCDIAQGFHFGRPVPAHAFSVQGFCFGKAVSAETFARDFDLVQARGRLSLVKSA